MVGLILKSSSTEKDPQGNVYDNAYAYPIRINMDIKGNESILHIGIYKSYQAFKDGAEPFKVVEEPISKEEYETKLLAKVGPHIYGLITETDNYLLTLIEDKQEEYDPDVGKWYEDWEKYQPPTE